MTNIDPSLFAELAISSNFTFLKGASHPEEIATQAKTIGLAGFSICDENSLAGSVRGHIAAKEAGIPYRVGCRLVFCDGTPDILIWPRNREAYGRLCHMLSIARLRSPQTKQETRKTCHLTLDDCIKWADGSILALIPDNYDHSHLHTILSRLSSLNDPPRLIVNISYGVGDKRHLAGLRALAAKTKTLLIASNLPLYHTSERKAVQDVITSIRMHTPLSRAGTLLAQNAERYIKTPADMGLLSKEIPEAFTETIRILKDLTFSLDELRYNYPQESYGKSNTPQAELERLAHKGIKARFPDGISKTVKEGLIHELNLIGKLGYAPYFLTVYDIVRFARSENILCQGRGSAANSITCFCLGITEVNPDKIDVLFERFISEDRREPPDIDVDFEHERREEVIQYVYRKYGRHRAGLAATVVTYRARSAIREVGKAFGLSEDAASSLSSTIWGWSSSTISDDDTRRVGYDPNSRQIKHILKIVDQIVGFPRHLSQHVGGFVITHDRLDEVVPLQHATMEGRTIVEWDKDDLDQLGILKIDILALGMLSCLKRAFDLLYRHYGHTYTLATLPEEDKRVYAMISRADTLGVFQIESRAQMSMLPRLRPQNFYDLVIEVAIVRPGPIQGNMVHPYLRRRQGLEPVSYPSKELEVVLGKTLGIPLFQEQAMRIAIIGAGFTPGEADRLRRSMATFRRIGTIGSFRQKMIDGMSANGYDIDFAERCFTQIEGFGDYGFPESHAASFALLVYASCWFKCFYPDIFATALLNSQPMGFYAPAQIIRDAREHGVEILPVDINHSIYDNQLEQNVSGQPATRNLHIRNQDMAKDIRSRYAIRLGFRQIKGVSKDIAQQLVKNRATPYRSVRDLSLRGALSREIIERLADADAFRSIKLDRRKALWQARNLDHSPKKKQSSVTLPLFDRLDLPDLQQEPTVTLPEMPLSQHVINDYQYLRLSLKAHPVSFVRDTLTRAHVRPTRDLETLGNNHHISIAGLVLVRQRPGSAKGVIFQTIEDETGIANVIVWPKVFHKFRPIIMGARFVKVTGKIQKADGVIHLIANHIEDWTPSLAVLSEEIHPTNAPDKTNVESSSIHEGASGLDADRSSTQKIADLKTARKILPKGRNFH